VADTFAEVKRLFFDRRSVLDAADKATRAALSRFGAFVRQRSRSSIRTRKGASPPGSPPFGHTGRLKAGILFYYDPARRSVIVGPTAYREGAAAPRLLESGGVGSLDGRPAVYAPRPFMLPAFKAELRKAPQQFKDQIRG
jgi:hypothetical protein